jgi:lipopolysaccharide export LptBFGC system permease protein LptF
MRNLILFIIIGILSACSETSIDEAKEQVGIIQKAIFREDFNKVYGQSSMIFKGSVSESDFYEKIGIERGKTLGRFKNATLVNTTSAIHLSGSNELILVYITQYDKKNARETFDFIEKKGKYELMGYKYTIQ